MNWLERHGEIIYRYSGDGYLKHEKGQSQVSFQVAQLANGKILCECEGDQDVRAVYVEGDGIDRLVGHSGRYEVVITRLISVGFTIRSDSSGTRYLLRLLAQEINIKPLELSPHEQPEEMRFALTNLEFVGLEPYTEIEQGIEVGRLQLHWELDGCAVTIRPLRDYKENVKIIKATQGVGITAMASVSAPNASLDIPKAINLMDDLCLLLTLARGCGVQWLYRESASKGQVVERYHWNPIILPYTAYDVIPKMPPGDLRYFVARCFDPFRQKKKDWQLKKVIRMYTGAKVHDFVESRALKICVLMDFLRGTYLEMRSDTHLIDEDAFKHVIQSLKTKVKEVLLDLLPNIPPEHLGMMTEHVQGFNWYPFRRSIKEMRQDIGLKISSKEIDRFVKQRNELVHHGRFLVGKNSKADVPEKVFREMMTLVGKVLLAILEYDGWYYDWTKPSGWIGNSEMRVKMPLDMQNQSKMQRRRTRQRSYRASRTGS